MRSSLLKQLAIHCSLLLVKSTNPGNENESINRFGRYFGEKILSCPGDIEGISYKNIKDYIRFKDFSQIESSGLMFAIHKDLKERVIKPLTSTIETKHPDLSSIARDVESSFVKLLCVGFLDLEVLTDGKSAEYVIAIDKENITEFLCLHVLSKHKGRFLLFLCNSILDEFKSAGASEEVLNSIEDKLHEFIKSMNDAIEELKKPIENNSYANNRLQYKLNALFKLSSSAIFMVETYYQAFLYVELRTLKGESGLSDEALKRYIDLFAYISSLHGISRLIHHITFIKSRVYKGDPVIPTNIYFYRFIKQFENISDESLNKLDLITSTADIKLDYASNMSMDFADHTLKAVDTPVTGVKNYAELLGELYNCLLFIAYEKKRQYFRQ